MKKKIAIFLAIMFLFTLFPVNAFADMGDYGFSEMEPNDSMTWANEIYNDCTVYGTLTSSGRHDFYEFDVTRKSEVAIISSADERSFDVYIMNDYGSIKGSSSYNGSNSDGTYCETVFCILDPGTYYVLATDSNSSYVSYTFYITITPWNLHTHDYATSVITDPTCVDEGFTTYTCECGVNYKDDFVSPTGVHTYQNNSDTTCDVCGFVKEDLQSDISLATLEGIRDEITVSNDNKQIPTLILNGQELNLNTDYVVWYYNTGSIGTAKMLIIGIGDYTGYIEKEYEITGVCNLTIGEDIEINSSVPIKIDIGDSFDGVEIYYDQKILLEFDDTEEAKDFFNKSYLYGPQSNDRDGKATWTINRYNIEIEGGYKWNGSHMVWTETHTRKSVTSNITTFDSPVTELTWAETQPIMHRDKLFVQPSIYPVYSDNQELAWSSSDESIATVDDFGVVTIVAPGTCVITAATSNGLSITQELSIEAMDISRIETVVCKENEMGGYSFTVKDEYGVLKSGKDYEVSYQIKNNIVYATFEGIGLYDGTMVKYYDIANDLNELSSEELHYAIGGSGEHIWQNANCTSPKTCTICDETEGDALGHDWQAPTCTDFATCARCMVPSGGILGHVYSDGVDGTCNRCAIHRNNTEKRTIMDMFRMYDPNSGEHFYTGSEVERENLIKAGWNYEGVGFTFSQTTGAPVYRLYDSVYGEHLYTMDITERDKLMKKGWNLEGVAFNSAYDTEVPQYRLHNPNATRGAYHFTASSEERNTLISLGWEDQGIGWYSIGEMIQ